MKKITQFFCLITVLLFLGGCDKDFVEVNTDPFAINKIDPALLFAGAQRVGTHGRHESENTIVQHFVNPFNEGATKAFNFNADIDLFQTSPFSLYTGPIKAYVHILDLLEGTTTLVNLQSMVRIMKAFCFMVIVDHYGDVPYFNAGLAAIEGETAFFPEYDDDSGIYENLYTEISEAIANLNPAGDFVSADLFYGFHAYIPVNSTAVQVEKWKKLGNSLLLRLGMRYSKANPDKAQQIVSEAFNGGVMTSNDDNAFVTYDGTLYTNGANNGLIDNNPRFYYAAEPLVNQLKKTQDPRTKYLIALFANPGDPLGDENPNHNLDDMFGVPVGVEATSLGNPPYRGTR
ncbi:MAG: SusD/RagB family nutrient-binding outer membrane lipoprotein, partial [Bacteroidales bacterium]|nr:SusD/RagB family nutrient-binding outer membrane lipoprotein [Bacteroidales bacterium]